MSTVALARFRMFIDDSGEHLHIHELGDATNVAPFASHILVFGTMTRDLADALGTIGSLCSPRRRQ